MPLTLPLISTAHAEPFNAVLKLGNREVGVLQRHGTERDKALRPLRHDLGETFVHHAREFLTHARVGPVVRLLRCGRDRLDVDAHAVHVFQAHFDAGELCRAVVVLLLVRLAGERVGELDLHFVLARD